jgi:threonine dehydrogenase-like Zn-dependent dehydrogenase
MKDAIFKGRGSVGRGERPDPSIKAPTDAVVRVTQACVSGSDLWDYHGQSDYLPDSTIVHEVLGVVELIGDKAKKHS